jgi:hypothetical protein
MKTVLFLKLFIVPNINPNPHCFIAIPKPRLVAEKSHYYPTPCTAQWEEGEKGGATSIALKICLIKT